MALFAFEELTFRYPEAPRDALRDVSVAIEPGRENEIPSTKGIL